MPGATVDTHLTNYAQGFSPKMDKALADFIAPRIQVPTSAGEYTIFDSQEAFLAYDAQRPHGQNPNLTHHTATKGTYSTKEYGLGQTIDPAERRAAGPTAGFLVDEAKTKKLITNTVVSHEKAVWTAVKAGISATTKAWGDDSNDPIKDIQLDALSIYNTLGVMPNAMVISYGAWAKIANNAKVTGRMPGADNNTLNRQILASFFPNMDINPENIRVGAIPVDSAKKGGSSSKAEVTGTELYLFYREEGAGLDDPSFAKTFVAPDTSFTQIVRWDDGIIQQLATTWAVDIKVTAAAAAKRYTVTD